MSSLATSAPLTDTLRYPATHLVDLGRLILFNYESHLKVQETIFTAAYDSDDDDDEHPHPRWEVIHNLEDVKDVMWLLDRPRYLKEEQEEGGEPYEYTEKDLGVNDPKQAETLLLIMGMNTESQYVIPGSVKLRKEQRGDPPEGGWEKEDALLDLLEFISMYDNSHLFRAKDD